MRHAARIQVQTIKSMSDVDYKTECVDDVKWGEVSTQFIILRLELVKLQFYCTQTITQMQVSKYFI